ALMPPRFGMASLYTKLPLTDCPARLGPADADAEVDALPDGEGEDRVEALGVGESLGDGDSRVEVGDGLAGSVAAGPGDPPVRKGTASPPTPRPAASRSPIRPAVAADLDPFASARTRCRTRGATG